jgi:F-type H+-transporting ATPase subunit epsilon
MSPTLRLTISTPASILVDAQTIVALRAEDESGSFGILAGHADFLTVLTPSVLRWRGADHVERFCAVEEGVLRVSEGRSVTIACRKGVLGDSLAALETRIEAARISQIETARNARVEQTRLHAQAVRQLLHYLRPSGMDV